MLLRNRCLLLILFVTLLEAICSSSFADDKLKIERVDGTKPKNVVFILSDDHRYDVMGFMGHPFVKTPNMDAMAKGGVHYANAFVTTSLCSPSRASILTGRYMHNHGVVDNNVLTPKGTIFFPQYLQKAGYQTAFCGKWHMGGHSDAPRPGFDKWVSFKGQGRYYPPKWKKAKWSLNVDGKSVPQKGYITDELTDYALEWLGNRDEKKPFFLYLSHKGVHGMFEPAKRHAGRYKDKKMPVPDTMKNNKSNNTGKPMWVQNQRNSWHGMEFAYHKKTNIEEHYRLYCEALLSVDDSIGRVMKYLKENNLEKDTIVYYMGDNGFQWGEHGLIDKRTAYEESMRVPLLAICPSLYKPGTVVKEVVANIDIGPTILKAAGVKTPSHMDGQSFLELGTPASQGKKWRENLMYEYYWEWNYAMTPTIFALRGAQYKLITAHGIWDTDELYDVKNDPHEKRNLITEPSYQKRVKEMRKQLYDILEKTDSARVPFSHKRGTGANLRLRSGSKAAEYPEDVLRNTDKKD